MSTRQAQRGPAHDEDPDDLPAAELSETQVLAQAIATAIATSLSGVLQGLQMAQTNALNELRAGMADQNANLGNTINAAIQAVGNGNPVPPPVQAQVAFARNPGGLNPDAILNFERKEGQKFHEKATKSIYSSTEDKYDMDTERFGTFVQRIKDRATLFGFLRTNDNLGSIMMISNSIDVEGNQIGPFVNTTE